MTDISAPRPLAVDWFDATGTRPVGGPVSVAWREGTLTRAKELESLCAWVLANNPRANAEALARSIPSHLEAARQAAEGARLEPRRRLRVFRNGPRSEERR